MTGSTAADDISIEEIARMEFEPFEFDLAPLRGTYDSHWQSIALTMLTLRKTASDVHKLIDDLDRDDDGTLVKTMMDDMVRSRDWFRQTADLIDTASSRLICGLARQAVAKGGAEA